MKTRGFTLIELLVVIAIIGILSSVVLASLNTARSKGTLASFRANLHSIQTQAEIYRADTGGYGSGAAGTGTVATSTACSAGMYADRTIQSAVAAIRAAGGTAVCGATTFYFSVSASSTSAGGWCVNSAGIATSTQGC